jgi:hypothetical protein
MYNAPEVNGVPCIHFWAIAGQRNIIWRLNLEEEVRNMQERPRSERSSMHSLLGLVTMSAPTKID